MTETAEIEAAELQPEPIESLAPGLEQERPRWFSLPEDCEPERWADLGRQLRSLGDDWHWWVADWLTAGVERWGESRYAAAEKITGLGYQTLRHYAMMARRYSPASRFATSFSNHMEALRLPEQDRDELLALAAKRRLSSRAMRLRVNRQLEESRASVPAPEHPPEHPAEPEEEDQFPGVSLPIRKPSTKPQLPGQPFKSYEARPLNPTAQRLVDQLKARRLELGWSLNALDERAGWSEGYAAHYEAHDRNPSLATLDEWTAALGMRLTLEVA